MTARLRSRLVPCTLLALWCATTWWLSAQSDPGDSLGIDLEVPDWLVHGIEYAVGGFLAHWSLGGPPTWSRFLAAVTFCVLWGAVDEWHQSWVPGRDPSVADGIADGVGGSLGTLLSGAIRSRWLSPGGSGNGPPQEPRLPGDHLR